MTELERLIAQQARELAHSSRTFRWSRRSVSSTISLDQDLSAAHDGSLVLGDVLEEGVDAWAPWRFAPSTLEPGDRSLGITDALTLAERGTYYDDWPQR